MLRAVSFLLYDHIGGVNTMLYTLSNAGCMVTVRERSPDAILAAIERHRVDLLPTSARDQAGLVERLKARRARFATLIHPTALVTTTAEIGEGVVVYPFCTVSDHVQLEDFTMLNFSASVGHDARIGRYAILSPYATVNSFSVLGEEAFLGPHLTVTDGRKLGDGARVSANVAVHADVPPRTLVYGVPPNQATIFAPGE